MERLTLTAFATRVDATERTIQRYIKAGTLVPRRTPGGRVFFLDIDIIKYLNYNKNSGEPLVFGDDLTPGENKNETSTI